MSNQDKVVAIYIRVNHNKEDMILRNDIYSQKQLLEDYCKEHHIKNIIEYIDVGKSANDKDRKAFQQMIQDIKNKKVNIVIVNDLARLFRNPFDAMDFLKEDFMADVDIKSLDHSVEELKECEKNFLDKILNDIDRFKSEGTSMNFVDNEHKEFFEKS